MYINRRSGKYIMVYWNSDPGLGIIWLEVLLVKFIMFFFCVFTVLQYVWWNLTPSVRVSIYLYILIHNMEMPQCVCLCVHMDFYPWRRSKWWTIHISPTQATQVLKSKCPQCHLLSSLKNVISKNFRTNYLALSTTGKVGTKLELLI